MAPRSRTPNAKPSTVIAGVTLSNPQKVMYPELGFTKADVAAYYEKVADRMVPLVKDRLISVVRCPNGVVTGRCFYERHCGPERGFPSALKTTYITEKTGKRDRYAYLTGVDSIVAGVQMGTLEFHIWGCRLENLEQPDRVIMDVDPGEGVTFDQVRDASFHIRDLLKEKTGLNSVPLLTGGKGVHVIMPLVPSAQWDEVHDAMRDFAFDLAEDEPKRFVAQAGKAKRKGRIFVDYLRNSRGATAIAPYSTRSLGGATVAAPITWEELETVKGPNVYNVQNMVERVKQKDPWEESYRWKQKFES